MDHSHPIKSLADAQAYLRAAIEAARFGILRMTLPRSNATTVRRSLPSKRSP